MPVGATTGAITVTTAGGSAISADNFTVTAPTVGNPPTISSFAPGTGTIGTIVTISGATLTGASAVKFNGTSAITYTINNDSQITATVPFGATTGLISVTNAAGTTSSAANFTITQIKDITFGAVSLTGASGFDSTTGTVFLETASPIKGTYSMTISSASSTGTQNYPATNEIFISFYVRIAAVPSGQVRLLRISDSGTTVGAITLETTGKIMLRNGTTSVGATAAALTTGAVYRIGIRQKNGTGANAVLEAYSATGDAAFGAPFASSSSQTFTTQATSVQIGPSTGTAVSATFDDLRLDSGFMPGPSGP